MKFSEAIKQFCAWKKYDIKQQSVKVFEGHLKHFCLFLRNPDVETIKWGSIQEYLDVMSAMDWDKNSFQSKCAAFKTFFKYCRMMKLETLDPDVIPLPDREYKMPVSISEEDYQKLLNSLNDTDTSHIRNKALLKLLADSGMRIGEALSLDFLDLDLVNMCAMIKTEKTKALHPIRKVFWTEDTNNCLKLWITRTKELPKSTPKCVFFSTEGQRPYTRITASGVREFLTRYSKKAGLSIVVHSHLFRHRYGLNLVKRGANTHTVMNLMGHSNLNSSLPYTILAGNEMDIQADKFIRNKI